VSHTPFAVGRIRRPGSPDENEKQASP